MKPAYLVPLPIIEEPFSQIAKDVVGPLPHNQSGNRFILVICDYTTHYPEAIPLKSVDAEHVAEELVKLFTRVGVPAEICLLHIKPICTSPYHPQIDRLVVRFNQTLKAMLQEAAADGGKDWDLLPAICLPGSYPIFDRVFPFELLYGRRV